MLCLQLIKNVAEVGHLYLFYGGQLIAAVAEAAEPAVLPEGPVLE